MRKKTMTAEQRIANKVWLENCIKLLTEGGTLMSPNQNSAYELHHSVKTARRLAERSEAIEASFDDLQWAVVDKNGNHEFFQKFSFSNN
jgi:hypothetical protein